MQNIKIIGLAGPKGVGKTTIAKELARKIGPSCWSQVFSFADPIRNMARAFGLSDFQLSDTKEKEKVIEGLGISPREFMQRIGTDFGRSISKDVWIHAMEQRIKGEMCYWDVLTVIIDDVRFDNEAEFIRAHGGKVFELGRDDVEYTSEHSSEAGINPVLIDCVIEADCIDYAVHSILAEKD